MVVAGLVGAEAGGSAPGNANDEDVGEDPKVCPDTASAAALLAPFAGAAAAETAGLVVAPKVKVFAGALNVGEATVVLLNVTGVPASWVQA